MVAASSASAAAAPVTAMGNELKAWKQKGVNKESVRHLGSEQLAACLAAFIVQYSEMGDDGKTFSSIKETLRRNNGVRGEMLADAGDEDKKTLLDALMNALADGREGVEMKPMRMWVEKFLHFVSPTLSALP